jgi:hypothetical protein
MTYNNYFYIIYEVRARRRQLKTKKLQTTVSILKEVRENIVAMEKD